MVLQLCCTNWPEIFYEVESVGALIMLFFLLFAYGSPEQSLSCHGWNAQFCFLILLLL